MRREAAIIGARQVISPKTIEISGGPVLNPTSVWLAKSPAHGLQQGCENRIR